MCYVWRMAFNSKYFDMIRIARPATPQTQEQIPICEWEGCDADAHYPALIAPLAGESREKRYFCLTHIQHYNRNYNFFAQMDEATAQAYRESAATGHRPTWSLGARRASVADGIHDPLEIMENFGMHNHAHTRAGDSTRRVKRLSRGQIYALEQLGLDETAEPNTVRRHYKKRIKRFHPDANGGNRQYEENLQKTIHAYDYLKTSGFC